MKRRSVDYVIRILDQMEDSQIARDTRRYRETIKIDLEINELDRDITIMMSFDSYKRPI